MMSDFETQARIVHTSNQIRDEIKNLYEWEKDIKQKEGKRNMSSSNEEAFDPNYPMRSHIQKSKPSTSAPTTPLDKPTEKLKRSSSIPNAIEQANEFKTRGNDCVKKAEYQKAIHYYTEAIRLNQSEAVFFTNRAFCYLKQNKCTECIADCTTAIGLDAKAVKAYYRRMQAHEQMNSRLEDALNDCRMVLSIDPKNVDAQRSLARLETLVKTKSLKSESKIGSQSKQVMWSQFDGKDEYERVDFVEKEPHARSKQALKRIAIVDSNGKCTPVPVTTDLNRVENKKTTSKPAIDQTVDVNKIANVPISNQLKQHTKPIELVIPKNSAQFYKTWTSLKDDEQKFTLLKGIYKANVHKMIGAQFNLDILRGIFAILKSHFMKQNLSIANLLDGIMKNSQMPVISAMMNSDDHNEFKQMLEYMRVREEDSKKIDIIEQTYQNLISM